MLIGKAKLIATAVAAAAILAGCSGGSTPSESTDESTGVLKVGSISGTPPYTYFGEDGQTVIGYEPDLIREAATRIGLEPEFTILDFDALLPGLDSQRLDLAMAGFSDRPARQQKYDLVDVAMDRFAFIGREDVASQINTLDDLCGRSTGAVTGGAYVPIFEEQSAKCVAAGKEPVTVQTFDGDAQGFLAVKSGQTDFWPTQALIIQDWVKSTPGFGISNVTFLEGPTAFVMRKNDPMVAQVRDALQSMVDDGTYDEILQKYGVESIAVDKIELNAGK